MIVTEEVWGRLMTPSKAALPWVMRGIHDIKTFYLPTEVVVTKAEFVVPRQGRIYDLPYDCREEMQRNRPDVWATETGARLSLVEVYEDWGDDGHTELSLTGFVLLPTESLPPLDLGEGKRWCKSFIEWVHEVIGFFDPEESWGHDNFKINRRKKE
jgi:hypothetical protein